MYLESTFDTQIYSPDILFIAPWIALFVLSFMAEVGIDFYNHSIIKKKRKETSVCVALESPALLI